MRLADRALVADGEADDHAGVRRAGQLGDDARADRLAGALDVVGEATGNVSQQIKGGAKQVEGKVQRGAGNVEKASDKADDDALD